MKPGARSCCRVFTMMKHQTLVQSVTMPRYNPRSAVRSLRAASPDRALAQLIAMHVPSAWR